MTREEILAMEAGPELNELVAEKVFGLRRISGQDALDKHSEAEKELVLLRIFTDKPFNKQIIWLDREDQLIYCKLCGNMPDFSGDIAAAWEVVEKMSGEDWYVSIHAPFKGEWYCEMLKPDPQYPDDPDAPPYQYQNMGDKTAPEAICKAALLAVLEVD